jgi:diphthine-ammonia ligase
MVSNDVHAILIKVAGIGLEAKHLGKTLAQMQSTLQKLVCCMAPSSMHHLMLE